MVWRIRHLAGFVFAGVSVSLPPSPATAQETLTTAASSALSEQQPDHQHMNIAMAAGWQFMQDGVVFGMFNHQGGTTRQ
jgi:hypothetical protein